jgi:hypothetical protein
MLLAAVFLSRHAAAQLECSLDRGLPLWNHIWLPKWQFYWLRFYCLASQHRCPGHPAAQLECPQVRNSPLWNRIHLHKRGNFICCGVLVRAFSCQVRLSSSQRLITVEPHPPAHKGQILFAVVFLSGHIAPSWSVLQLENHHFGTTSTCANRALCL